MLNSVGLAGPGVAAWREKYLPDLERRGCDVVGSIWGRTVAEFADAAEEMRGANVIAVEVNASCPNLESRSAIFAHSALATAEIVRASKVAGLPLWIKLSPNTPDLIAIAEAALDAGADALVLVNTVLGLGIDIERRRPSLGNGGGGVSGPGILPVALRSVYECRSAFPDTPIVGVGGVSSGEDAVAMIMAGANAVEVGTATFADPRAPWRVQRGLDRWMRDHEVSRVSELMGVAHG
jgi:dihydroorotate dehydrogenase (NAD+) catalytic subunit